MAVAAAPADLVLWIPPNQGANHIVPVYEGRQTLVDYAEPGEPYHHRVLLSHLEDSRWVVVTPTGDVFEEEFDDTVDIYPLLSGQPFPRVGHWIMSFRDLTPDRLARYRAEAQALAGIFGGVAPAPAVVPGAD